MLFLLCQTLTEISFHPGRLVFFELSHCTAKKRNYDPLQQKNPRDKVSLQKKVRILNRLIKAGTHQATSCSNTSQQPIVLCVLENFCEKFYQQNYVLQQVIQNQIRLNLFDLWRQQNSVAETRFPQKFSSTHTKRFVVAPCRAT